MRTLQKAPDSVIDAASRAIHFGSYEGSVAGVDLRAASKGRLHRIARHKRWLYASVATDELFVACAVVHLGYSATAFVYVYDAKTKRIVAHESRLAPAFAASVVDDAARGVSARFSFASSRWAIEKGRDGSISIDVRAGASLSVQASLAAGAAPPSITAIAKIPEGVVDVTEKRSLLAAKGAVTLGGRRWSLDGGLGGFDVTQGLLARHTKWRWAFALGRDTEGNPLGMNLVRGFVGEAECALWSGDRLYPLGEGVIDFDRGDPRAPWTVKSACGAVNLRFSPMDFHREDKELIVASSHFVQAVGEFDGTITLDGGRELRLERVLGVTEEQDTRW